MKNTTYFINRYELCYAYFILWWKRQRSWRVYSKIFPETVGRTRSPVNRAAGKWICPLQFSSGKFKKRQPKKAQCEQREGYSYRGKVIVFLYASGNLIYGPSAHTPQFGLLTHSETFEFISASHIRIDQTRRVFTLRTDTRLFSWILLKIHAGGNFLRNRRPLLCTNKFGGKWKNRFSIKNRHDDSCCESASTSLRLKFRLVRAKVSFSKPHST